MKITIRLLLLLLSVAAFLFLLPLVWDHFSSSNVVIGERLDHDPCRIKNAGAVVKSYYPSGQLRSERSCKNGRSHGVARTFSEEGGCLAWEETYVDGKRDGVRKEYYPAGAISRAMPFKNGQVNGVVRKYNPDGTLDYESHWRNDRPAKGEIKKYQYYANGKTKAEYVSSPASSVRAAQAVYREFFPQGQLQKEYLITGWGRISAYKEYDENGILLVEQKGGFSGARRILYDDGILRKEERFLKGVLVEADDYFPDGKIRLQLKDGKISLYDNQGTVLGVKHVQGWTVEQIAREYGDLESYYGLLD